MTSSRDISELAQRCKGSVTLEINPHRNCYESIDEYLEPFDLSISELEDLRHRLAGASQLYRLSFYLQTPVGFYYVFGASLQDVLEQAHEILIDQQVL
jgi:hypothetical protein